MEALNKLWKEANEKYVSKEELKEDLIIKSIQMKSKHIVNRMKSKFLIGVLGSLVGIGTVWYFMFSMGHPLGYLLNAIIILFLFINGYLSGKALFDLHSGIKMNLKENLKICHGRIKRILHYQNVITTFLSGTVVIAFLFRRIITDDFPFENYLAWAPYIASLLIVVPAAYFLGGWNNRRNFGDYLNSLQKNIERLDNGV